jgi:LuxR family maltose regulon positive regulatory protein
VIASLLTTKLDIPPPRPDLVSRSHLVRRLDEGLRLGRRLTLVSAPAGYGKTTLLSEWIAGTGRPAAWLSLDESDNDPVRFETYVVGALQQVEANLGRGIPDALRSPQRPPIETLLTALINQIDALAGHLVFVLDDYHVVTTCPIHNALALMVDNLPLQLQLVIASRADLPLPLARLRGRGQLTELRQSDLRFSPAEAAAFLKRVSGRDPTAQDVSALEERTEGWITGLQLAALSMRGREDVAGFVSAFAGSHRFILDYLTEEVLQRQSDEIQGFLLQTPILDRLGGPLCDAVLHVGESPSKRVNESTRKRSIANSPLR